MVSLRGTVWITGASSGIGRTTAILLARHGWKVAASARNDKALASLAELQEGITPYPLDIVQHAARQKVYRKIRSDLGPVDVLVNNAGYGVRGAIEEVSLTEYRNLFDVNVYAPIMLAKLVLPEMRERRQGRIVMVSSLVGRVAIPTNGAYSASKFALEGLTDAMRIEVKPWNVIVSLVEPGPIRTNFGKVAKDISEGRLVDSASPYYPFYEIYRTGNLFRQNQYWGASTVADAIADACENPKPRVRYPVHPVAFWLPLLAKMLPARVIDSLLGKKFGFSGGQS